jgi:hypothetical protein
VARILDHQGIGIDALKLGDCGKKKRGVACGPLSNSLETRKFDMTPDTRGNMGQDDERDKMTKVVQIFFMS